MLLMDYSTEVTVDSLLATLGINNRKAHLPVTHQNPFEGCVSAAANKVSQQKYGSQRRCLGTRP